MAAYYNENDPFAAAWLRELIKAGLIADGEVDERDIRDVRAADLAGFVQCHFFAGIGGWSYALRLAGWPDDRPVWTGSCPCQPFSGAGANLGGDDPRHLWPAWFRLIRECRPDVVFGEQVEAAINHGWFDLVSDDLEGEGYAVGAAGLPACGVGAFHIRQRLWFVAESHNERHPRDRQEPLHGGRDRAGAIPGVNGRGAVGELGDSQSGGQRIDGGASGDAGHVDESSQADCGSVAHAFSERGRGWQPRCPDAGDAGIASKAGFWADAIWIPCRDGKARPTQPEIFPLASGVPNRVGTLRGAGNAIVPQVAQAFIESYLEAIE